MTRPPPPPRRPLRIVLTGGPGGGKTTAADLFRREIGDRAALVPEAATLLYAGGFPRPADPEGRRALQRAIYHVQSNLEDVVARRFPERILLCDRGTLDGAAYWPDGDGAFFDAVGSTEARELARYDAVIFFETAAAGGGSIEGNNPTRIETATEAIAIDRALQAAWARHPRFTLVRHERSFLAKIMRGLGAIEGLVAQLGGEAR